MLLFFVPKSSGIRQKYPKNCEAALSITTRLGYGLKRFGFRAKHDQAEAILAKESLLDLSDARKLFIFCSSNLAVPSRQKAQLWPKRDKEESV